VLVIARGPAPSVTSRHGHPDGGASIMRIGGPWSVGFDDPLFQTRLLPEPVGWDTLEDTRFFSGVATYDGGFTLSATEPGTTVTLDFGAGTPLQPADKGPGMRTWLHAPIRDAAVITVNGQRAGSVWCPPYRLDITPFVKDGANTISIRVGNTALNHMAGRPPPDYRLLTLRYGERFQAQGMELVAPLPSGLLAAPTILRFTPLRSR
jgi:hypothetical protein